jgi:hypothetical protein
MSFVQDFLSIGPWHFFGLAGSAENASFAWPKLLSIEGGLFYNGLAGLGRSFQILHFREERKRSFIPSGGG